MTEYNGAKRSKTEQLRKLLDDRGVKWKALSDRQEGDYTITATRWHDSEGGLLTMCISEPDGSTWDFFWYPSPKQAVEATLGRETCKWEPADFITEGEWWNTSCGGSFTWEPDGTPNFCPNCGRRVEP